MRTYSRKRPENQLIEGVESLCRLCLSTPEEAVPIFADNSDNVCASLALRIMICVGLEMTKEDCLPNMVCCSCLNELERYYAFRKKCEVSYQKLKSHVLAVRQKEFREQLQEKSKETEIQVIDDEIKVGTGNEMFTVTFDGAILLNEELPGLTGQGPLVTLTRIDSNNRVHLSEIAMTNSNNVEVTTDPVVQSNDNKLQQGLMTLRRIDGKNRIQMNEISLKTSNQVEISIEPVVQCNDNNVQIQTKQTDSPEATSQNHELEQPTSSQSDPDMPLSTFLTNVLVDLGILSRQGEHLVVVDPETRTVELGTEDGGTVRLELMEEDAMEQNEQPMTIESQLVNIQVEKDINQYINMGSADKSDTSKEIKNKKGGGAPWCVECGRGFASGGALRRHALAVHLRRRPHACPLCPGAFAQREVLKRHQLLHQESRPFACDSCEKSFTQRAALSAHRRSHAPPHQRPLRLHRCRLCPKLFLHASGLSRHSLSHSGVEFGCGGCARTFRDRSAQRRHLLRAQHPPPDQPPPPTA